MNNEAQTFCPVCNRLIDASTNFEDPEGIKGAQCTALASYLALHGAEKKDIRAIATEYYPKEMALDINNVRDSYNFDETCQGTVSYTILSFLAGESFEDVIRTAISLGGDSDTVACIAGSIAEAFYPIPDHVREKTKSLFKKDLHLKNIIARWERDILHN